MMAMWTPLLLVSAYITIVWEILFGVLVWRPIGRYFTLGVGALFHIMTNVTLGLIVFPAICISGYLAFVTEDDVNRIRSFAAKSRLLSWLRWSPFEFLASLGDKWPVTIPATAVWGVLAALTITAYSEAEHRLDVYGMQANGGPMELTPIDRETALTFLDDNRPLREKDKYFSFEIGTRLIGGQLGNTCNEFEYGELIIAQCNLNPPHEDLWVELLLKDEDDHVVELTGQFVTREMLYANFYYDTGCKLVPGEYSIVLRSSGKEIFTRQFTLTGDPECIPAMTNMLTN